MFGSSRKKDTVTVATLFGIDGRALRRKNLDADEMVVSTEFQAIGDLLIRSKLEPSM